MPIKTMKTRFAKPKRLNPSDRLKALIVRMSRDEEIDDEELVPVLAMAGVSEDQINRQVASLKNVVFQAGEMVNEPNYLSNKEALRSEIIGIRKQLDDNQKAVSAIQKQSLDLIDRERVANRELQDASKNRTGFFERAKPILAELETFGMADEASQLRRKIESL